MCVSPTVVRRIQIRLSPGPVTSLQKVSTPVPVQAQVCVKRPTGSVSSTNTWCMMVWHAPAASASACRSPSTIIVSYTK